MIHDHDWSLECVRVHIISQTSISKKRKKKKDYFSNIYLKKKIISQTPEDYMVIGVI